MVNRAYTEDLWLLPGVGLSKPVLPTKRLLGRMCSWTSSGSGQQQRPTEADSRVCSRGKIRSSTSGRGEERSQMALAREESGEISGGRRQRSLSRCSSVVIATPVGITLPRIGFSVPKAQLARHRGRGAAEQQRAPLLILNRLPLVQTAPAERRYSRRGAGYIRLGGSALTPVHLSDGLVSTITQNYRTGYQDTCWTGSNHNNIFKEQAQVSITPPTTQKAITGQAEPLLGFHGDGGMQCARQPDCTV
ncbi:unnamed protein product [Pleuronectes platessa]|uniref:Uncharacterized protein n=1 Tax=Pleuronectes platessa TaxID=8262 RepID=A0A9N7UIY6_PLEPL|nr:unnamed protein product [Pleuronectes platessa]